jgi:hypothetical protein
MAKNPKNRPYSDLRARIRRLPRPEHFIRPDSE